MAGGSTVEEVAAIVLSAGRGSRMNTQCPKQYLEIGGYPILYYSLRALETSPVQEIVLVVGQGEEEQRREEIVLRYGFRKIKKVIAGGAERYNSVYEGLKAIEHADYVLIHDGARPMLTPELISRTIHTVRETKACAAAVASKDSVKLTDESGKMLDSLDRNKIRLIQTPQAFVYKEILQAYCELLKQSPITVTDDTEVYRKITKQPVTLFEGDYHNIKVTTPEDLEIARLFLSGNPLQGKENASEN